MAERGTQDRGRSRSRSRSRAEPQAVRDVLLDVYRRMEDHFGPQGWWPGSSPFEVIVGAILTQGVAWRNVERAIETLRQAGVLHPEGLRLVDDDRLAGLIRPAGYYNVKARKLKAFIDYLYRCYGGQVDELLRRPAADLRVELLGVWGIGPETADSIILYASGRPVFVVDAYTRRIAARLGLSSPSAGYDELQRLFAGHLPPDVPLFNEYHALLVALGKDYCRPRNPRCIECPLLDCCSAGAATASATASPRP